MPAPAPKAWGFLKQEREREREKKSSLSESSQQVDAQVHMVRRLLKKFHLTCKMKRLLSTMNFCESNFIGKLKYTNKVNMNQTIVRTVQDIERNLL
jgi:hypothetical protein